MDDLAPAPSTNSYGGSARAGFIDGTDGTMRTTWRRSHDMALGFGWDAGLGSAYAIGIGGRPQREARLAASVASELATSNPVIATIIETLTTNALGTGLTLSSKPDLATLGISAEMGRTISHAIETGWRAWASNPRECDITGRFDVDMLASAFFKSWLITGEGVAALDWQQVRGARTKTKVTLLDPRQIDGSITLSFAKFNAFAGVVFDKSNRLAGFMIRDVPMAGITANPTKFVPAFTSWGRPRVIHAFEQIDAKQVRGLSPLVAALTPANECESLHEFSIANALIQTQFAATIESDLPTGRALGGLDPHEPSGSLSILDQMSAQEKFYGATTIKMSPGAVTHLIPGDKLKMNKVQNPGDAFEPFDKSLTRRAARAAGCMPQEIDGNWNGTNFSASRLAQEGPYRLTLRRRKMILERFYGDVFGAWLDEAIASEAVKLPEGAPDYFEFRDAYACARWLGIRRSEPDRKKAAEADQLELEMGLKTFGQVLAERGIDLETQIEEIKSERPLMRAAGLDKPFFPGTTTTQIRDETIEQEPIDENGEPKDEL